MVTPLHSNRKLSSRWQIYSTRDQQEKLSLRYGLYRPSDKPIRRAVIFVNGRTEWVEKNFEVPEWLELPADCCYLTWDHRGQGASGGARSYVDAFDTYVDDGLKVIKEALGHDIPYVIMAHSMGSLISLVGQMKNKFKAERLVLCSPLFAIRNDPVPKPIARPVSKLLCKIGFAQTSTGAGSYEKREFAENRLTHDVNMFELIKNSPYRIPSVSFGWVNAAFGAAEEVFSEELLKSFHTPTLILSSGDERVVDSFAQGEWVEHAHKISDADIRLQVIHEARHELLSEIPKYRDQAILHIKNWFKDFLS